VLELLRERSQRPSRFPPRLRPTGTVRTSGESPSSRARWRWPACCGHVRQEASARINSSWRTQTRQARAGGWRGIRTRAVAMERPRLPGPRWPA